MDQQIADAKAAIQGIEAELGALEEHFVAAKLAVEASRQRASALQADVAAQSVKVEGLRKQAAGFARATFQSAGVDTTAQLFVSGDPESFLQQISTVAKVDENINAVLQRFQAEQGNLADLKRAADTEAATAAAALATMDAAQASAKEKIAQEQAILARLSAEQQAALTAVQDGAPGGSEAAVPTDGSVTARAVAYAKNQVGDAYVWGAEGPSGFDCSGLMVASYRSAGVSIVHSAYEQSHLGRPVSKGDLQPGDLIFWYSPIHHVAIYVGGGMMVHARNVNVGVVEQSVDSYIAMGAPYSGAVRIVG